MFSLRSLGRHKTCPYIYMKQKFLLAIIFCLFALSVFGQTREAQKLDEFGSIPCDEYLARADTMIAAQANNPGAMIHVFIYEGKSKTPIYKKGELVSYKSSLPPFGLAKAKIDSMKKYLKRRKIPVENYVFANGGFREDFWVEIWVVPPGAEAPKPTSTVKKMKYRKGKASGFCTWCC
jgi:hypothetical protein